MHHSLPVFLAVALCIAPISKAAGSLNPFDWFGRHHTESSSLTIQESDQIAETQIKLAKQHYEAGKFSSASRALKKIIKQYPTAPAAGEALALEARIDMRKALWSKGFNKLQRVINEHPGYPHFDRIISDQFDCATALMEGARGRILWIFPGFKQYGTSVRQFEQIVSNAPYGDYAPLALMNIALVSEMSNEPAEAIEALDRLINYYPQSMLASDAYYTLAQTYADLVQGPEYDQGSTRRAISYYEDFLILFPTSNYVGEVEGNLKRMENVLASSRLDLGDFYYYFRNNNTAALIFYNETITIEPNSDAALEARRRIQDIEAGVRPTNKASILRRLLRVD